MNVYDTRVVQTYDDTVLIVDESAFTVATVNGDAGLLAWLPYRKKFGDSIKAELPLGACVWVKQMKAWFTKAEHTRAFGGIVERYFGTDLNALADVDRGDGEESDG